MKDIDFDELDRAVGSVLGADADTDTTFKTDTPDKAAAVATATPAPAVSSTPAGSDAAAPAVTAPADDADKPVESGDNSSSTPQIKTSVSPARKRGQFLDMVHPSADMRKAPLPPSTPRKTLTPLNTAITQDAPAPKPAAEPALGQPESIDTPQVSPVTPEVIEPVAKPAEQSADAPVDTPADAAREEVVAKDTVWPDPLDFAKDSPSDVSESSKPGAESTPEPIAAPLGDAVDAVAAESAQTPFVTDAKVDKRPLGAFAAPEEAGQDAPAEEPAHPTESQEPAPEFNPEVNSVESAGVPQAEDEATGLNGEAPKEEIKETPAAPELPGPKAAEAAEAQPASEEPATSAKPVESQPAATAAPAASVATGAQSIPQQYKTTETHKEDDGSHPLFDTEEYHQPLLADGKQKTKKGLLIIVMLLVLLVIGAVLGYFAYTMGI